MSTVRVKVGTNGRLVIPAELRKETGITDGKVVIMENVNGELRVRPMEKVIKSAQERLRPHLVGKKSMAEDLIADRRSEATRENKVE